MGLDLAKATASRRLRQANVVCGIRSDMIIKRACLIDVTTASLMPCPWGGAIKEAAARAGCAVVLTIALGACGRVEGRLVPAAGVLAKAKPTSDHPLSGFWAKGDCSREHGLAIGPVSAGIYFVSFCTQFDCFAEGTYRYDTPIYGDASYRVIDENTIEVYGNDGGFTRYVRCPTLVPRQGLAPNAEMSHPQE